MRLKSPFSPSEAEARWLRSSFGRRFNSLSDNFNRFSFGCILRCFGFGQLGSTLFSTLLGLFAGFSLLRIIPGSTFLHAGGIQEASDAVGRLCANGDPVLGALDVQNNALLIILGEQRIVAADTIDETIGRAHSALQSLMSISYAQSCLTTKN